MRVSSGLDVGVLDLRCGFWTRGEGSGPEVWVLDPSVWVLDPRCGFWTRRVGVGPEVWVLDPSVCVLTLWEFTSNLFKQVCR